MRASSLLAGAALLLGGCGWFGPVPYEGQVVDPAGHPLAGAVVASDKAATLTGADGRFRLPDSAGTLTARKIRYASLKVSRSMDRIVLTPEDRPVRVAWDQRWQSPAMEGLKGHLAANGFAITPVTDGALPEDQDLYVLASPSWFNQAAYEEYLRQAGRGAKILLLGEWGGYDGIDLAACNSLGTKAGITFVAAAVRTYSDRTPEEWLTFRPSKELLGTDLAKGVRLFTAGALDLQPPALSLLATDGEGIRIQSWSRGVQSVAAAGPLGRGSLVALADTSLWTDETDSDGSAHWKSLDNPAFAVSLLNW